MRKLIIHIIIYSITLLLFSCAGMSKDENIQDSPTETEKSPIFDDNMGLEKKTDTTNIELTTKQKEAFQLRAIQKFQDFTDYLKIISTKKVAKDLKEHSIQLALELFINDSVTIPANDSILGYESVNSTTPLFLKDYLYSISAVSHLQKIIMIIKTIEFTTPLAKDSVYHYSGILQATLIINGIKSNKNIEVHLVEVQKIFGDNHQDILEVKLGNID